MGGIICPDQTEGAQGRMRNRTEQTFICLLFLFAVFLLLSVFPLFTSLSREHGRYHHDCMHASIYRSLSAICIYFSCSPFALTPFFFLFILPFFFFFLYSQRSAHTRLV